MKTPLRLFSGLLLLSVFAAVAPPTFARRVAAPRVNAAHVAANSSRDNARHAQALLGPTTWSQLIRVTNLAVRSVYPATVYALVFEEAGILWFYTDTDGTQSFSLHPDRLAEEKADFGPLLRAIEPGFAECTFLSDGPMENAAGSGGPLPNGCFVESLAALRERVARGEPIERARLLSCYVDTPQGLRGHTVLTFETPRGLFLLDPARSPEARSMPRAWQDDAMALASAALEGAKIARARWVPTTVPSPVAMVASLDSSNDPVSRATPRLMR